MIKLFIVNLLVILAAACTKNGDQPATADYLEVPTEFGTVQQAIDSAKTGDVIIVDNGTYSENLVIRDKDITLASRFYLTKDTNDIYATILDGNGKDAVIELYNTSVAMEIVGFTIQNADDGVMPEGKMNFQFNMVTNTKDGIDYEKNSGGICKNNVFKLNRDDGIDLDENVDIVISQNLIINNHDDGIEIRLHPYAGEMLNYEISNNWIQNHGEDGIQVIDYPDTSDRKLLFRNNMIINTDMAAIGFMSNGDTKEDYRAAQVPEQIQIVNNTLVNAVHGITGGGNALVLNNIAEDIKQSALKGVKGNSVVAYHAFHNVGTAHDDCLVIDSTLFTDAPLFDQQYRLSSQSSLIDKGSGNFSHAGHSFMVTNGISGTTIDLGAAEHGNDHWINTVGLKGKFVQTSIK